MQLPGHRPQGEYEIMMITIEENGKQYDIKAGRDSKIENTLDIMKKRGLLSFHGADMPEQIYSVRRQRRIPVQCSYRENGIYQGDILRMIEEEL